MHLETLKIFCDVVRHQSFSRGATANDVSQSAASQAIHQLEKRLGVQLIDRSKRPWILTPDGQDFFVGCSEIVERYQELEAAIRRRQTPSGYKLRVAAIYSVGLHDMSQYVDRFRTSMPGATVTIDYIHPEQVYERVRAETADLGLISFARHSREFTLIPWRDEEMVLACLPEHPLASETSVAPQRLAGEPFVRFERRVPIRRELDRFLKLHQVDVKVVAEFDNIPTVKQAVEDGAGIAILPEPTFRREVARKTLAKVRFDGEPFVRPLSIIHRRKRRLSKAVQEFIEFLCAAGSGGESSRGSLGNSEQKKTEDDLNFARPSSGAAGVAAEAGG